MHQNRDTILWLFDKQIPVVDTVLPGLALPEGCSLRRLHGLSNAGGSLSSWYSSAQDQAQEAQAGAELFTFPSGSMTSHCLCSVCRPTERGRWKPHHVPLDLLHPSQGTAPGATGEAESMLLCGGWSLGTGQSSRDLEERMLESPEGQLGVHRQHQLHPGKHETMSWLVTGQMR